VKALIFWKTITVDHANLLERLVSRLREDGIRYCVIGGQAVNAYVEPVVSLDLDIVVAVDQLGLVKSILQQEFKVETFAHSLNVTAPDSDLRVQVQLDARYGAFLEHASVHQVLGTELPVAAVEDVLQGKVWAVQDPDRRASKRQKDLADIARIVEAYPPLRAAVPPAILARLL
jgi:hypothetical protein